MSDDENLMTLRRVDCVLMLSGDNQKYIFQYPFPISIPKTYILYVGERSFVKYCVLGEKSIKQHLN